MAKALMFLGTASESGKSILAASFCRILHRRGVQVAPFKAQNMALNSGATPDGREMGRAQIVQAECAGIEPHVDMNPILLKPTSEKGSQVIVHGKVTGNMEAARYYREKKRLWPAVTASYDRLAGRYEVIILEGAGSPVEVNLKENDIVNMSMAEYADARVLLVADIDRGGVFASIVGTVELLAQTERERLIGFIINKFRGDASLLEDGLQFVKEKTGYPVLGVVPYLNNLHMPGEDSVALEKRTKHNGLIGNGITVGIIRLPHISNYTDFDPLECDPRFVLHYLESPHNLRAYDVVILPGSKNVFFDYQFLVDRNFNEDLITYYQGGGRIVGICGGFQMLGTTIRDPHKVEGTRQELTALGVLPVVSVMAKEKVTERVRRFVMLPGQTAHIQVDGYEIHMGHTTVIDDGHIQFLTTESLQKERVGVAAKDGRIWGTYMHGFFDNDALRGSFIAWVRGDDGLEQASQFSYAQYKEQNYNRLADTVEEHVDVAGILHCMGLE